MKHWNINKITDLLHKCGEITIKYYENPQIKLKDDHSIVTIADKEVEDYLSKNFDRPEENVYMIGEETVINKNEKYISDAWENTAWIIDPIDGTAPYANHIPTWGISIGFAEKGTITEGAIYLPVSGDIFITSDSKVLYGTKLYYQDDWSANDLNELTPVFRKTDESGLITLSQTATKKGKFRGHNPIHTVCSAVYSLGNMLLGRYLAYVATVKIWDIAAALALMNNCNFKIRQVSGAKVTNDISDKFYFLSRDDKIRWQVREHIVFAPTDDAIDFVLDKVDLPE